MFQPLGDFILAINVTFNGVISNQRFDAACLVLKLDICFLAVLNFSHTGSISNKLLINKTKTHPKVTYVIIIPH